MKRVMVGLSGGVDSAVAAARLQAQGYEVIGVFIKVWHPDFLICDWESERRDAMRVAAHLNIPFLMCDAEEVYYTEVAKYFIEAYRSGVTPNPDVMCNRAVKFGAFWEFAYSYGVDYIATGHYAQNLYSPTTQRFELHRGIDQAKDQTYFLWTLTQDDLTHTLFPIGDTTKSQIRSEAVRYGLPTAKKNDSQGICFLGHVDIPVFLSHFIDLVPGEIRDSDGAVLGRHRGSVCYTIGQRHGLEITSSKYTGTPYYVQDLNHKENVVVVAPIPPKIEAKEELNLHSISNNTQLIEGTEYEVQLRYRQTPIFATCNKVKANSVNIRLEQATSGVAPGQSCVLYQGTQCFGGGIIQ